MTVQELLMQTAYCSFYEKLQGHFRWRGLDLSISAEFLEQKKTRKYQHFQIMAQVQVGEKSRFSNGEYNLVMDCRYNLTGDLQLYVKLGNFDMFHGAADEDSWSGQVLYHIEDIIRSFADASPNATCAIIKI